LDGLHVRAAPRSSRSTSCGAIDHGVFWLYHAPSFYVETRSWVATAIILGFLLLPHLASRFIVGWLYNGSGSSVLIAGLFHAVHNAMVNPTGLGIAVYGVPQTDILVIISGLAIVAGGIIAVATRGRLGLRRPSGSGAHRSVG